MIPLPLFWIRLKFAVYGLTHRYCRCGVKKGRTIHKLCIACQCRNIERGLMCESCGCTPWRGKVPCGCDCHGMAEGVRA